LKTSKAVKFDTDAYFSALECFDDLKLFKMLAKPFKFNTSYSLKKTASNIIEQLEKPSQLAPEATSLNLLAIYSSILVCQNSTISVVELDSNLSQELDRITNDDVESTLYIQNTDTIHQLRNGVHFIGFSRIKEGLVFSIAYISTSTTPSGVVKKVNYCSVFKPLKKDRFEIRVSTNIPKKDHDYVKKEVMNCFTDEVGIRFSIILTRSNNICFFKSILNFYDDQDSGRADSVIKVGEHTGKDATLNTSRSKSMCARSMEVSNLDGKVEKYICRSIILDWKNKDDKDYKTTLTISPKKHLWEKNSCSSISLKHPTSVNHVNKLIDNVIKRSL